MFHCFGCGASGDVISFVMRSEHLPFAEAAERLAHELGLPLPEELGARGTREDIPLYALLEEAAEYYQKMLWETAEGHEILDYLRRERCLTEDSIRTFRLGYAPSAWDTWVKSSQKSPERLTHMTQAGLVIAAAGKKPYDRFRHRIMFPISDSRGRVVAFGGRALGDAMPKYLNSPETRLFHKGRMVYGLSQALATRGTMAQLLVVEGYLDVISLAQAGFSYAVATMGTAVRTDAVALLFRYTQELVFCFDGDAAGLQAAYKAMELVLPMMQAGRSVKFLILPGRQDPDDFIRSQGGAAFAKALAAAQPLSEYLLDRFSGSRTETLPIEERSRYLHEAIPLVQRIPDDVLRTLILEALAARHGLPQQKITGLDSQSRKHEDHRSMLRVPRASSLKPIGKLSAPSAKNLATRALEILTHEPSLAQDIDTEADRSLLRRLSHLEDLSFLMTLLDKLQDQPAQSTSELFDRLLDEEDGLRKRLGALSQKHPDLPLHRLRDEWHSIFQQLCRHALELEMDRCLERARSNQLSASERERLQELFVLKSRGWSTSENS